MSETIDAIGYKADVPSRTREAVDDRVQGVKSKVGLGRDKAPGTGDAKQGAKQAAGVGIVALVLFIVASVLFSLYVANFSSYNKTYGSLGAVIAFLVWLWITNIAVLFGAEFNAELQRSQQRQAGRPAPMDEPFLEPRDASKQEKAKKKD